jgi:hypothetical protein
MSERKKDIRTEQKRNNKKGFVGDPTVSTEEYLHVQWQTSREFLMLEFTRPECSFVFLPVDQDRSYSRLNFSIEQFDSRNLNSAWRNGEFQTSKAARSPVHGFRR